MTKQQLPVFTDMDSASCDKTGNFQNLRTLVPLFRKLFGHDFQQIKDPVSYRIREIAFFTQITDPVSV